ncbi:hypothetical protein HAL013_03160 [Helicobacter ailurogastricus]|uniref:Uncharacterized protein n=1 Tax=Helicobacter ailurogastricus TaxID=1578720 RepID=A0A0K2X6M2_9HELI|nr:hypothetical protein HAL011_15820 [Helicobacter ailurogastricus]CRF42157.1 hypothetical protein HAL013_03160 [Helicobacter ailurogastricus]CRF43489.1 hypothetical protein HAL09_00300 [Helicobacter ailurogastricus]
MARWGVFVPFGQKVFTPLGHLSNKPLNESMCIPQEQYLAL